MSEIVKPTAAEIAAEKLRKPALELVPPILVIGAGRAFAYGRSCKHQYPTNLDYFGTWRDDEHVDSRAMTHYGPLLRHLHAWRLGETTDPESGVASLDLAAARLAMMMDADSRGRR